MTLQKGNIAVPGLQQAQGLPLLMSGADALHTGTSFRGAVT